MRSSRVTEGADALALVDAVARRIAAGAAPVRFRIAAASDEREAVYRLRAETVVAEGWAAPEDLPGGLERDGWDDVAVHVAGWEDERLTAVARLVFPAPGRRLPTEEAFDLEVEPPGDVVDLGRLVVARPYRGLRHRVHVGLLGACWLEIRSRGFSRFCAVDTDAMLRLYRGLGFEVTRLGPPRRYWGMDRYPVRFEVERSADALHERWGDHGAS